TFFAEPAMRLLSTLMEHLHTKSRRTNRKNGLRFHGAMPRQIFSVARPVRLLPLQRSSTSLLAYQLMMFIDKAVHIPGTVPAGPHPDRRSATRWHLASRHGCCEMNSLAALVTDVTLKGQMKGWEIARLVRQIDPAFPVVYMTGAAAEFGPRKVYPIAS